MVIKELIVYSFKERKVTERYPFNFYGLNIILGERREKGQETNGVGKSTMISTINYLLGRECPKELSKSKLLCENQLFVALNIEVNKKNIFLGRYFLNAEDGYVLENEKLSFELTDWIKKDNDKYREYINTFIFNLTKNTPRFTSLREYIVRDEKTGFMGIGLPKRTAADEAKYLSYLFNIPTGFEEDIKVIKNKLKTVNDKLKVINSLKNEIVELKAKQKDILKKMKDIDNDIKNVEIVGSLKDSAKKYNSYRKRYNLIQNQIFELDYINKQYKLNIEDLEEKLNEIKKLNDIEPFYNQLIGYFPKEISKNQSEVEEFYEYMVENRGDYFKFKIAETEQSIKELKIELKTLEQSIKHYSSVFKQTAILKDITKMNEEKNLLFQQLDEVRGKISLYEEKSQTRAEITSLKQKILRELQIKQDIFDGKKDDIKEIGEIFNTLVNEAYGEEGLLEFELNSGTNLSDSTGRIKITCEIEDEESHGRHYMKVNMFDLTWLLYRIKKDLNNITFLIHDGSYSKPDKYAKVKLIKYVDRELIEAKKGQYFITANIDEIDTEDLKTFDESGKIVAKFQRGNDDKERFLGFRINNKRT
ncbi:hypothetical protein CN890_18430 [Priestia megaterium]|uniref:DUF2326 domain-containing protein n=1 Tax=Priestia megaterium TaxID=1404 RepID=UPI000BFB56B0|nr:DUF2326 domain-containing protein [Priestia megaterium]PGH68275.1 hypothetical protein CN890_18430 [Priestia megaterium]PGO40488.1 hypothetical protein CN973_08525 [Priestia megaterium]RFB19535.1 DUF2326 domain-containing protein [Bacillus sp. ALD]